MVIQYNLKSIQACACACVCVQDSWAGWNAKHICIHYRLSATNNRLRVCPRACVHAQAHTHKSNTTCWVWRWMLWILLTSFECALPFPHRKTHKHQQMHAHAYKHTAEPARVSMKIDHIVSQVWRCFTGARSPVFVRTLSMLRMTFDFTLHSWVCVCVCVYMIFLPSVRSSCGRGQSR